MDLNKFAVDVHANAVAHGWWDEEYTDAAVIALIHAEISEAFEEWRAGRPMVYYKCDYFDPIPCGKCSLKQNPADCEHRGEKPEGIATELADVVLRILDAAAAWGVALGQWILYPADNPSNRIIAGTIEKMIVPELTCTLHRFTNDILLEREYGENTPDESKEVAIAYPLALAITWVRTHGINPEALMREKHEYNCGRPYKHGGKRC